VLRLAESEERIYQLLQAGPLPIDAIIARSGLRPAAAASILVSLEMKGAVRQHPGKVFERLDGT
jgi:predicted Rossmann fold nucleotide-binding protein DprA/Smf involved in DNA uptake